MSYTALYREWRPRQFKDVVGQEHITTTLKNQIINNRIGHAYLFCGTRGTGKTSASKVFAKAINCLDLKDGEPCNECVMCKKINNSLAIDVTELDAASNNGIDNIRDINDDVKYPPQEAKYKIYIMDEAHMLSTGAVNAFLKTLEEPPNNVVFILATTDPQKLPITILSRCQRFDFKRINMNDIVNRLKLICKEQEVDIEEKSLNLIAKVSDGAMRDALSILDQAISMGNNKVIYEDLINMLGMVTNESLYTLTNAIIEKDIKKAINIIDDVVYTGKDIYMFIKELLYHFRNLLMAKVTEKPEEVLNMSIESALLVKEQSSRIKADEIMRAIRILQDAEDNAKLSKQGRMYLELAILKIYKTEFDNSSDMLLVRINNMEDKLNKIDIGNLSDLKIDTVSSKEEINMIKDTLVEGKIKEEEKPSEILSERKLEKKEKEHTGVLKERNLEVKEEKHKDKYDNTVENTPKELKTETTVNKVESKKNIPLDGVFDLFTVAEAQNGYNPMSVVEDKDKDKISVSNNNSSEKLSLNDIQSKWKEVLSNLKSNRAMVIYASLISAIPTRVEDNTLYIGFAEEYKFNIARLSIEENLSKIKLALKEIYKCDLEVKYEVI